MKHHLKSWLSTSEERPQRNGGERQLACKLIISALNDLFGLAGGISNHDRGLARQWIFVDDFGGVTLSWCCDAIGVDIKTIRDRVATGEVNPRSLNRVRFRTQYS